VQGHGYLLTTFDYRIRQDKGRIDRAHFGENRDRLLAGGGNVHEGAAPASGTRKTYGLNIRVSNQALAYLITIRKQKAEYPFVKSAILHGF
jgi:hypothetical protein